MCNLDCDYCFYTEKTALFGNGASCRMPGQVLRAFVGNYVESQPTPEVAFVWQGGEPTLAGLGFFHEVVRAQRPFASRKRISNALQTNGTLLTPQWCEFLRENNFIVGLSLDGPREVHDRYRRDRQGRGSFDHVARALGLLQEHGVEYNVMACVARDTVPNPLETYRFFRDAGVEFIQFAPVVERLAGSGASGCNLRYASPAFLDRLDPRQDVAPWSVPAEAYGDFLIAVFEEWVRRDVGSVFVMNFEWALNAWLGDPSPVCQHAAHCGASLVVEHNGDVYACDHCVYPEYRLGNVTKDSLGELAASSLDAGFGTVKETALPRTCRECRVLAACRGGCPKHRFLATADGEPGLQYLCAGYGKFFSHIPKYLKAMTTLLEHGVPVSRIMEAVKGPLAIVVEQGRNGDGRTRRCGTVE